MDSLASVALLPPTLASTEVLGPLQTRERLLVPEGHGLAAGIEDASRISLCMCPGSCASKKNGLHCPPRGSRLTLQLAGFWKSPEMLVLGTPAPIRIVLC